jgi:hypothetical protein
MPGPSSFIRQAVAAVLSADGGVLAIQTPAPAPDGFLESLKTAVEAANDYCSLVSLDISDRKEPPIQVLTETLTNLNETAGTIEGLLGEEELTDAIFFIHGVTAAQWQQWGLFGRAFEAERARAKAVSAPRIIFVLTARIPYSFINVFKTQAMMMMGASTRVDTELYVTTLMGGKPKTLAEQIAHATIVDIAAWDARLASYLAQEDIDVQLDPVPLLLNLAEEMPSDEATWANGTVDLWDGRQYAHSVITALDDRTRLNRRVWLAQSRILYGLFDEVLARTTKQYEDAFLRCFPITKQALGNRAPKIINQISQLELQDLHYHLRNDAPNELVAFLSILAKVRTQVAHMEACQVPVIKKVSEFWEYIDTYLPDTRHGWDWPSCGQTLTMMVGPSGAGKSTYAKQNFPVDTIISSDQIRQDLYGTLENTTAHDILFRHIRKQAITALRSGRSVLIDATHLTQWERMMAVRIVPPHVPITYIVINRPMKEKELSQGWRESRPGLLQKHETTFQRELPNILGGDGQKNVTVENRIKV